MLREEATAKLKEATATRKGNKPKGPAKKATSAKCAKPKPPSKNTKKAPDTKKKPPAKKRSTKKPPPHPPSPGTWNPNSK